MEEGYSVKAVKEGYCLDLAMNVGWWGVDVEG